MKAETSLNPEATTVNAYPTLVKRVQSFLTVHTNVQRRAIHDLASGAVMMEIRKPENEEDL